MKGLASVLSIIGFYLVYWIANSIYMSTLTGSDTIESIVRAQWIIAGVVCGVGCFINYMVFESNSEFTGAVIVFATIAVMNMPYSLGLVLAYNLICIGCILFCIWKN